MFISLASTLSVCLPCFGSHNVPREFIVTKRESAIADTEAELVSNMIQLADSRHLDLSRPLLMGVLNVTPDSFSDGGRYDTTELAAARAVQMVTDGADIIDIGGESTRPGSVPISAKEEQARVLPVLKAVRKLSDIPISIDTYHSSTAERALDAGTDIVNDISALRNDPEMAGLVADRRVVTVLMHMQGTPGKMQENPHYDNCVEEIAAFFEERLRFCEKKGIDRSQIILDPGIGFGKRLSDNLEILAGLEKFSCFELPILVGPSRKSFIGKVAKSNRPADERVGGSVAAALLAVMHGASIIRVHDVAATVEALQVTRAVLDRKKKERFRQA